MENILHSSSTVNLEQFKSLQMPSIQAAFILQYDGSMNSIINFPALPAVLNPTFSYHYFYVSGDTMENTVTTRDTTGESTAWGSQTKEMEHNAFLLACELRKSFNNIGLYVYFQPTHSSPGEYCPYTPSMLGKLFLKDGEQFKRIPGLTGKNIRKS